MKTRRAVRLAVSLAVAGFMAACGQGVRRTLPPEIRSIHVNEFRNLTDQGEIPSALAEALRREFRLDGRLAVEDAPQGADAVLDGAVAAYLREPARSDAQNVVQEYRVQLAVDVTLTATATGLTLWTGRTVTGDGATRRVSADDRQVVVPAAGLAAESEDDVQRRMVDDVARTIVVRVLEGW